MSNITIAEKFRLFANSAPILTAKYFFNHLLEEDSKELQTYIDEIKTGKTPPKSNSKYYESPDIKWYKPSDIGANIYLKTSNDTVSFEAKKDKKITLFKKGTLLITCIGDIGRIGILQEDSTSNQQITGIKLNNEILPEYAYLYLVSNRELFTDRGVLKTTLPIINQSKIKSIMIKVPDKALQQQIINHFMEFIENGFVPEQSNLDIKYKSKIEQFSKKVFFTKDITKKLYNNNSFQEMTLTKLKQSILQEAIEGKLTAKWREQNQNIEPASILLKKIQVEKEQLIKEKKIKKSKPLAEISKDEIPFEIPNSWAFNKLDKIVYLTRGSSPRPIEAYISDKQDGVNWIKIGDTKNVNKYIYFTQQKITPEGAEKSQYVSENDFILSNSMSFGKPFIMKTDGYIHDRWFLIKIMKSGINIDYFYHLLSSLFVQEQFLKSATGAVVKNIKGDIVKSTILPIPPLEEQKEIVNKIEKLFAICDKLEEQINSSKQNTQTLMQAVLKEAFER